MPRRLALGTIAATSAIALVVGCGSSSSGGGGGTNDSSAPPKTELTNALQSLSNGSTLTTTLALDTTAANIQHITGEGAGSGLDATQAGLIAGARIVIETQATGGKTLHQASVAGSGTDVAVSAVSGATTYVSLRDVSKTIYLQVDLKDLLGAAGESSEYDTLVARTSSMPSFVQAFIAGKTVSVPLSTITSLESLLKGYLQGSAGSSIPDGSQLKKLGGDIQRAVLGDVTVTRPHTGTTDQLVVTGNARNLARGIVSAVAAAIPAAASQLGPHTADQVPDQDLTLDAFVTGGAVSKLSFDVGQFSPHQKDTLPFVATFANSGPAIAVPSGATPVNFQDLISLFTAIGTSTSTTSAGSGVAHAHSRASAKPAQ
jgi:hypothetical protein